MEIDMKRKKYLPSRFFSFFFFLARKGWEGHCQNLYGYSTLSNYFKTLKPWGKIPDMKKMKVSYVFRCTLRL